METRRSEAERRPTTADDLDLGTRARPRRVTDDLVLEPSSLRPASTEEPKDERSMGERFVDFFRGEHEAEARAPVEGRFSVACPEMSTVFAIGAADASTIGGWKGTFRGVTLGTVEDVWVGARATRLIAGVPGEGEVGALDLERAALAGEETLAWVETAIAAHMALETGLNFRPSVSTLLRTSQIAMNLIRTSIATDDARAEHREVKEATTTDGEETPEQREEREKEQEELLEERAQRGGQLHLHGEQEVLLSSPGQIASTASTSNLVYGGMLAEVVGGLGAGVKGGFGAEVAAIGRAAVSGYLAAAVEAVGDVEIVSKKGGVEIGGASIGIGSQASKGLFPPLGQAATSRVAIEAETSIRIEAGEEGPRVALDAGAGRAVVHAANSFVSVDHEKVLAHAGKKLRFSAGGLQFLEAALAAPAAAEDTVWQTVKLAGKTALLDLLAMGVGTGVAAGADALDRYLKGEGKTPSSPLADVMAGSLTAMTVKGLAEGAAHRTATEAANATYLKALNRAVDLQDGSGAASLTIEDSGIVLEVGLARLEMKPDGITLSVGGRLHAITIDAGGVTIHSGVTKAELRDDAVHVMTNGAVDLTGGPRVALHTSSGAATLLGGQWHAP